MCFIFQGNTGDPGPTGEQGEPGIPGARGVPGKNVREAAMLWDCDLQLGFHSYVVLIYCVQGIPGTDGVDGINGTDGIPGDPGRKGFPVSTWSDDNADSIIVNVCLVG